MNSVTFLLDLGGLFLLALASNATPFFGASYTLVATAELIALGFTPEGFAVVVVVTAIGATLGKVVLYASAKGLGATLRENKNVRLFGRWEKRRAFYAAVFVTALVPALPLDDYIYIGAGANGVRLVPLLLVTVIAKSSKSTLEIALEFAGITKASSLLGGFLGLTRLDFTIALSLVFIALGVILYKIDWEGALRRFGIG